MKSIILVRHAKSSWKHDVIDRERPLKSRGKNDAKLVAKQFLKHNIDVDKVFSSPAKRADLTCKIFSNHLKFDKYQVQTAEELYDFGGENVISFIKSLKNELNTVMIFGHNHAFTSISNIFGSEFISNLPTSGLVKMNFDISSWEDLKKGETEFIIIPKELR
ncbi:SixA phosphatase family protein [Winogradskyella ursingii]|uniref:SixA phosphatase family protein n=1 Tax=Winogradskyella ursingii TaxID=2686079 RepID=UPI0015CE6C64|nr:histidine phosphatase family protein [Winogradskyella ursingii]